MPHISHIVFKPAKGDCYGTRSQFNMGVLIVGESHYAEGWDAPADKAEWTTAALKQGCSSLQGESQFWRTIPRTVMGWETLTLEYLNEFWSHVALYNYFQHPVTAANPATVAAGRSYRPQFLQVLAELRPELVLVFSAKAWWAMPPGDVEMPALQNGVGLDTALYNIDTQHQSLAVKLRHPRSGLSPKDWYPYVINALGAANKLPLPGTTQRAS